MNERIFKLALQAMDFHGAIDIDTELKLTNDELGKFAELIVQECIKQCNVNFVGTVGSHPNAHNRGVKMCIDNIKEHFGVEE